FAVLELQHTSDGQAAGKSDLMPSAASFSNGERREPVRPIVVVDEFTSHALGQMGIGVSPAPNLKGLNRLIFEAMRLRDWVSRKTFIEYVWGHDGATPQAVKQAIHRFNSDPNSPFQLSQEVGQIKKVNK